MIHAMLAATMSVGLGFVGVAADDHGQGSAPSDVPAVIQEWFSENADAFLRESLEGDVPGYVQANPNLKASLDDGAMPHAERPVAELHLDYPTFDLRTGQLEGEPIALPEALYTDGKYCAVVTVDDLFTDSIVCAPLTKKASREYFSEQSYSSGLLASRTEFPADGYIGTLSGMFSYDTAAQTVTAMDERALQNVPRGTISVSDFETALARADAERSLYFEKYGPSVGGGDFPLFGGTADERADHDAEIARLLDAPDWAPAGPGYPGSDAEGSEKSTARASATPLADRSDVQQSSVTRDAGIGVGVVLLVGLTASLVVEVRRRLRRRRPDGAGLQRVGE